MAINILPIPGASVGLESLFSWAKEVATDWHSLLDPEIFEQIECLKYHWKPCMVDLACTNEELVDEIDLDAFTYMESSLALFPDDTDDEGL